MGNLASLTQLPSLYDVVKFALGRPSLRRYTERQLAELYYEYKHFTFAFTGHENRLRGAAIAHDTSEDTVRIRHICHDGGPDVMAAMVRQLRETFPGAKWIEFHRRGKECRFQIGDLDRLLKLLRDGKQTTR